MQLYNLLKANKEYFLRNQMLDAAISIPSNIAEGCERGSKLEFKRFLRISKGSAAELRTQMYIAKKAGLINDTEASNAISELMQISRMLQGLIDSF